jgi:hypothetical protein
MRKRSRYSDWLRDEQAGDRITGGGGDFPRPTRPNLGPTQPCTQEVPVYSRA